MNKDIPIMLCFDNNYVIAAAVAMYSMLENSDKNYNYTIYVCHTDISTQNQAKLLQTISGFKNARLEFLNMNGKFDKEFQSLQSKGHYSKEMLYKLLVANLFPQHKKIIVTDVDVVFTGDISKHYMDVVDNDDFCVAGVYPIAPRGSYLEDFYNNVYADNFTKQERDRLSLCGGYLIFNLEYMRRDNSIIENKLIQFLNENSERLVQPEQDVINLVVPEKDKILLPLDALVCSYCYDLFRYEENYDSDPHYSAKEIKDAMAAPIQLHFATQFKPWREPGIVKSEIWLEYLLKTPFVKDWCQYISTYVTPCTPFQNQRKYYNLLKFPLFFRRRFSLCAWRDKYGKVGRDNKVVVICLTYNQEKFIRKTLDGFISQKVNCPVEFIISDDGSSDGTADIIREYAKKYPDIITPILHPKNKGVAENAISALRRIRGQYVAWCDGDDCWTDPNKLQMQVDILNKHPDCSIVCTDVKFHYVDDEKPDFVFKVKKYMPRNMARKKTYDFDDLLNCRFIASCTAMVRWKMVANTLPDWLLHHVVIDFPVFLIHAHFGDIRVINKVTAQYNISGQGVSNAARQLEYQQKMLNILRYVDKYLNYAHTDSINKYIMANKG